MYLHWLRKQATNYGVVNYRVQVPLPPFSLLLPAVSIYQTCTKTRGPVMFHRGDIFLALCIVAEVCSFLGGYRWACGVCISWVEYGV